MAATDPIPLGHEKTLPKAPSDAFVFFGATGDLAHKKVFPALQGMIKRGTLSVPIIGGQIGLVP